MKRMNPKARRYLLTRQPEPFAWSFQYSGGRWGLMLPRDSGEQARVYHFASPAERAEWLGQNPRRRAIGKRHPLVKAFRQRLEQERRHERDRERLRDAAYTAWVWEAS